MHSISDTPNDQEVPEEPRKAVLETGTASQPGESAQVSGSHSEDVGWKYTQERDEERERVLREERSRARQEERQRAKLAAWKSFMQAERQELELRKNGQLARLLGDPLPEEPPDALQRLAAADQRQAEESLVALMSSGEIFYKHVEELSEEDMPARIAASSLRTTWLKQRREVWGGYGDQER